jgi:hypothetical protein
MTLLELPDYLTPEIDSSGFSFYANDFLLRVAHPWSQLELWHQAQDVEIKLEVFFDLQTILIECGLAPGSKILAGLSATSTRTKTKIVSPLQEVTQGENVLKMSVSGYEVGGALKIEVFLTVSESIPSSGFALEAPKPWAMLWSQFIVCHLEGSQSRAEVHPVDLQKTPFAKAMWVIRPSFPETCNSWITAELNNTLSIEYNMHESEFVHSPKGTQLLTTDYLDVILETAITTDGVLELILDSTISTEARGTLMRTASNLVAALFQTQDADIIRSLWARRSNEFRSTLQHMASAR